MPGSTAHVDPDELLYRRIPATAHPPWVDITHDPAVKQMAFIPHRTADQDGISLIRAKYRSARATAENPNRSEKRYWLAVVRAGDLQGIGLSLNVTPDEVDQQSDQPPAHVCVRQMHSDARRDLDVKDWARQIAERLVRKLVSPEEAASSSRPEAMSE